MAQKVELYQFAFNGGELHPALHARSDQEKYAAGAALVRNMVARPYGGAYRRVGMHCIAEALPGSRPSRLVEFEFNETQRYMLEFGDFVMRILNDDALVVYPAGHAQAGQIVRIATPYSADEAHEFDYDQTADLMIITHRGHPVRNLIRYDHHDFRFRNHDLKRNVQPPAGLRITLDGNNGARYCVCALKGSEMSLGSNVVQCHLTTPDEYLPIPNVNQLSLQQLQALWTNTYGHTIGVANKYGQIWPHEWDWIRWTNLQLHGQPTTGLSWSDWSMSTISMLVSAWVPQYIGPMQYVYISGGKPIVLTGPDGSTVQFVGSDPNAITLFSQWAQVIILNGAAGNYKGTLYDKPLITLARDMVLSYVNTENDKIRPTAKTSLAYQASANATSYYIFREGQYEDSNGETIKGFFYIGTSTGTSFTDDNLPLNVNIGLPVSDGDPFDRPGRYPAVCSFFEQRAIFGNTAEKPNGFWGSQLRVYNNFDKHSPLQDDDSYNYVLDSRQVNAILWLVPMDVLLMGTSSNEWKASGNGGALTPKNPDVRVQSWQGCSKIRPVIVGRSVIFAGKSRRTLRDLSYSLEADGFDGDDLTLYAQHLFEEKRIVAFSFQRDPDSILWVVLDDGTLLSCTYLPQHKVVCWSRHDTSGRIEGTNSLADSEGEDRVYFIVTRVIGGVEKRFIEVMKDPLVPSDVLADAFYVDCGLSYHGSPTASLSGLEHLEGREVEVLADGFRRSRRVANGRIDLDYPASVVHVGLGYKAELDTLDLQPYQQPVKNRAARAITKAEVAFHKTVECRAGPLDGPYYDLFAATGDGEPAMQTTRRQFHPATESEPNRFQLHFEADGPYPLAILSVAAQGEIGGA